MSTRSNPASVRSTSTERVPTSEEVIKDDDTWTEGDFTLLSSDNVRFKARSHHVLSASKTFEDMSRIGSFTTATDTLETHFTDPVIETASSISNFLYIAKWWKIPPSLCLGLETSFHIVSNLAIFLKKYECDKPLAALCIMLDQMLPVSSNAVRGRVFVLACRLGNEDLAQCALGDVGSKRPSLLGYFGSQMTREELESLPEDYRWALLRAVSLQAVEKNVPAWKVTAAFKECIDGRS